MGSSRLRLEDDLLTMMTKMSEGNPGGLTVLMQLLKDSPRIDPDAAMGPLAHIFNLDSYGIYGSHIWILFKDICGQDITKTITVLRSVQMGLLSQSKVTGAIRNVEEHQFDKSLGFDIQELFVKLKEQLPNFAKG